MQSCGPSRASIVRALQTFIPLTPSASPLPAPPHLYARPPYFHACRHTTLDSPSSSAPGGRRRPASSCACSAGGRAARTSSPCSLQGGDHGCFFVAGLGAGGCLSSLKTRWERAVSL